MSSFAHVTCPCGWAALLAPLDLDALRGCRVCGGPVDIGISPLPWHQPAVLAAAAAFRRRR